MLNMLAITSVNELMNKVLSIVSPVLITIGGVSAVILIGECYLKTTLPSGKLFIKKIAVDPTCLDGLIQHLNK